MDDNFAVQLQEVKDRSLRNEGRIKKLEKDQQALLDLTGAVRELANEQGNMKEDIGEIKSDVKHLSDKPGKRWEGVIDKLLAALVGAFVAWVLSGGVM